MNGSRSNGLTVSAPAAWPAAYAPAPPPVADEPQSAFAVISDRLHGRLKLAIGLGLVLGGALGLAGYRFAPVRFASLGTVHVASTGQAILRETDETELIRQFEGMKRTKELQILNPRVIHSASRDPEVAALPFESEPVLFKYIEDNLSTKSEFNTELISVTFEAEHSATAKTILDAVLRSFMKLYGTAGGSDFRGERMETLVESRDAIRRQRAEARDKIQVILVKSEYGTVDLQGILDIKLEHIEESRQELEQIRLALAEIDQNSVVDAASKPPVPDPTDQDLIRLDSELGVLIADRDLIEFELRRLAKKFSPNHQDYRRTAQALVTKEGQIELRREAAMAQWFATGGAVATVDEDLEGMTPEQLKRRERTLLGQLDKNREAVKALNIEQGMINDLQDEITEFEDLLAEVTEEIQVRNIEANAQFSGRVSVMDWGMVSDYPATDRRRPFALIGFTGGFGLSCGLFFLLGSLDRRAYSVAQLQQGLQNFRCLGVLPFLGSGKVDADLNETAAQCVHQIRNRIEALRDPVPGYMLVVTSPYQGDGKTSLAMALGWSYAAAGHRTLLVDCDFYGHSLTSQMGLNARDGVREVLRDRRLGDQVFDLSVPNLSVLGAGVDASFGPESIRRDDFNAMCGELRSRFDVIIADTGPFIGSVELLPVAAAANNVVFSVRRGRSRNRLDECLDDLRTINVPCLGVVLNCADRSDCNRYVSKSTVSKRHLPIGDENGATPGSVLDRNLIVKAMNRPPISRP